MTDRKHIDPTIYTTRPTDERLEKENRVYDLLEELNIPFVRIDHDAMNTIDECQDVDRLLGVEICKNLFLCNSQIDQVLPSDDAGTQEIHHTGFLQADQLIPIIFCSAGIYESLP